MPVNILPAALINPLETRVLAVMILAVDSMRVHELLTFEYWYETLLTTVICPFVGDVGKAICYPLVLANHDFNCAFVAVEVF